MTATYNDKGIQRSIDITRSDIASREIIKLADYGIDVNPTNYLALSNFLMDIERENLGKAIVDVIGLKTLGFATLGDSQIFLTGSEYITGDGIHKIEQDSAPIEYIYPDVGTRILFEAIHRNGNREDWIDAVKKLNPFPYLKIAISVATCSSLLKPLRLPNFIVHLGFPSSSGKTSCLKIAASACGNPEILIETWNSTAVAIEQKAYSLSTFPSFLDETKTITVKNKEDFIRKVIYMISSGVSKGRGNKNGMRQEILHWNSVCFSTGEANLLTEVEDGGAKARVLDLPDMPFKEQSLEISKLIDTVISATQENYGHAVVEVMSDVLKKGSNSLEGYSKRFAELCEELKEILPPGVGIRLANIIAFCILAVEIVNKVMGLEWTTDDVKTALVDCALKQSLFDSEGNKALYHVYNYAIANTGEYCDEKGQDISVFPIADYGVNRDAVREKRSIASFKSCYF